LFLGKSTKSAATSEVHFLTPICTKLFVGWGFVPDPTGELTAPPEPLSVFRGPTSKGRGEEWREWERRGRGSSSFALCRAVLSNGHVPRAPGFFFFLRGPQLAVVK